jgi:hypothetical protein
VLPTISQKLHIGVKFILYFYFYKQGRNQKLLVGDVRVKKIKYLIKKTFFLLYEFYFSANQKGARA